MKYRSAVSAVLMALALSACMTSPPPDPNAIIIPPPGQGGTDSPPPPGSSCTGSSKGATGINTCKELERMGGLLTTYLDLGSLGFSMAVDRVQLRAAQGTAGCPNGGTIATSSRGIGYRSTLTNCEFGLGAFSGTVDSEARSGGTTVLLDITRGSIRYEMGGYVLHDRGVPSQVALRGLLSAGSSPAINVDVTIALVSPAVTSSSASIRITHNASVSTGTSLQTFSPGQDLVQWANLSPQLMRLSPPSQRSVRYTRVYSNPSQLIFIDTEANLTVSGDSLSGPLTFSNKSETLNSSWTAIKGSPRYDFAD